MNCTFYRPTTVNVKEFENIVGKLYYDLHQLKTEHHDEWSIYTYLYTLSRYALPLEKNPDMSFFGLAAPESMPSDARADYFYRPTYIATAFMIKAVLLYPSLMNGSTFLDSELDFTVGTVKKTLRACMLGCTGNGFYGAEALPFEDCVKLFEGAGAEEFVSLYPDICPEFTNLFLEAKVFIDEGKSPQSEMRYY